MENEVKSISKFVDENLENSASVKINRNKKVLCISGGIDSIAAWFYTKPDVAVYFNLGTKYTRKEIHCLECMRKLIPGFKYTIDSTFVTLGQLQRGENAFIPHRNLLLAALATRYGNNIIIAGIKGDNVSDKNPEAFQAMEHALDTMSPGKDITVRSPFWDMTKTDIVQWMLRNVLNAEKIIKTSVSCYSDEFGQCGQCSSCFRKWIAIRANNIDDKRLFREDVRTYDKIPEYIEKMLNGEYDEDRTTETLSVLQKEGLYKPIIEEEANVLDALCI